MSCCRNNCVYLAIIIGIITGVVLGVLSALGFISTGIIYWVYAVIGVLGVIFSPLYAQISSQNSYERCFCFYRSLILTAAIGTIISSVVGLIIAGIAVPIILAIVTGVSTFFLTALLVSLVCLSNCICADN